MGIENYPNNPEDGDFDELDEDLLENIDEEEVERGGEEEINRINDLAKKYNLPEAVPYHHPDFLRKLSSSKEDSPEWLSLRLEYAREVIPDMDKEEAERLVKDWEEKVESVLGPIEEEA
jgi:hypothetical protein